MLLVGKHSDGNIMKLPSFTQEIQVALIDTDPRLL